jgi:hypothetical protein
MQELSQEFTEQLESGKSVAKLVLYKPDEPGEMVPPPGQDKRETEPEESKCTGEDISTAQTDAIFGAAKVIYGCCPMEGDTYPLGVEPDR